MARRKKQKTASRRRRVSGIGKLNILTDAALATAGFIAGRFVSNKLPIDNVYAKAGVQIAGAIFLPRLVKGNMGNSLAIGMGVSGVSTLVSEFAPGVLSGVIPTLSGSMMLNAGPGTLGAINPGEPIINTLAGTF